MRPTLARVAALATLALGGAALAALNGLLLPRLEDEHAREVRRTQAEFSAALGEARQKTRHVEGLLAHAKCPTPEAAPPPAEKVLPTLPLIGFRNGSARLSKPVFARLEKVAAAMLQDTSLELWVRGHTDARGSSEDNNQLGLRRARQVAAQLVSHGVGLERLHVTSAGGSEPLDEGLDDDALVRNRRVALTWKP